MSGCGEQLAAEAFMLEGSFLLDSKFHEGSDHVGLIYHWILSVRHSS